MSKYHITINENETGVVCVDADIDAIVGAAATKEGVSVLGRCFCEREIFSVTVGAAWAAVARLYRKNKGCRRAIKAAKKEVECKLAMEIENESPAS